MTGLQNNPPAGRLAMYGCDASLWIELRDVGLAMVRAGASVDSTPLRAYAHQRNAAERRRNIEWKLTLPEWWGIWQASGRWAERGVGRGYMMCRRGDVGPYAVGNVYIGPGVENLSAAVKKTDLPIGVAYMKRGKAKTKPYRAYCNIGGKQRHIGTFATVGEAEAAYLAARDFDLMLKSRAA